MSSPIPVAVIGTGHMGRHHVRIYHELAEAELVGVVDLDAKRASEVAAPYGVPVYTSITDVLDRVRAVSVAVPTVAHVEVAMPFLEKGLAVLIEKPIAPDSAAARRLLDVADRHSALIQVGHTERFNPVVRAMKRMEVEPRFIETHRISPFTFRSADVSVVMDMMIHDIDIVLSMVRSQAGRIDAVGVSVLSQQEDVANAWVNFDSGCVVNLTTSRLALKTERKIRVFSEQAYLSLDYQKKNGIAVKKAANLDLLKLAREKNAQDLAELAGMDFSSMVKVEPLQIDDVEPLRAELQAFLKSVSTGEPPEVSAADGLAALELAERIVAACREHGWKVDQ